MMECQQCGASLPEGQSRCDACEAAVAEPTASAEAEINRLLSEANLARLRGQQDDAVSLCVRVLRLDAANAAVHSLLGDIYREQGNYREALGWFKQAVALNPESVADRKKLDEMIDQVFQGTPRDDALPPAVTIQPITPAGTPRARLDLRRQFRRALAAIHPLHVVGACCFLAAVVMLIIALSNRPRPRPIAVVTPTSTPATEPATPLPAVSGNSAGTATVIPPTAPQVTAPAPDPVESAGAPTISRGLPGIRVIVPGDGTTTPPATTRPPSAGLPPMPSSGTPSANRGPQVAPYQPSTASASPEEVEQQLALLTKGVEQARKQYAPEIKTVNVTLDPRGYATIAFTLPPMRNPAETKQGLIYTAFHLVWGALNQQVALKSYVIHGSAYAPDGKCTPALTADITQDNAWAALGVKDYRAIQDYLTEPWWRSDLTGVNL